MIEHHAQIRHAVGDPHHGVHQFGGSGLAVSSTIPASAIAFKPGDELGLRELVGEVAAPQIAVTDAQKQRILTKTVEISRKSASARLQMSDCSDDDGVIFGDVEHPLVVFDERARLHLDGADDPERLGDFAIARRQRRHVQRLVVLRRPGHAARPRGVEQVNVRIDNRDGGLLRKRRSGRSRRSRQKIPPSHFFSVILRKTRSRFPPRNFWIRASGQPRRSIASVIIGRSRTSRMPRGGGGPPSKSLPSDT